MAGFKHYRLRCSSCGHYELGFENLSDGFKSLECDNVCSKCKEDSLVNEGEITEKEAEELIKKYPNSVPSKDYRKQYLTILATLAVLLILVILVHESIPKEIFDKSILTLSFVFTFFISLYCWTFLGMDIFGFKGHRLFGIKGFTKPELYKLDAGEYVERILQRFPLLLKFVGFFMLILPMIVPTILFLILEYLRSR
ncbi:MAG: hypothetical protein EBS13_06405 [Verrucomicrobia bacterium]|nr:hypothetical protein [Verrucomicrobiota bacterium]